MAKFYDQPFKGDWRYDGHPKFINIGGMHFRRADWQQPYPNVVAQYREDRIGSSHHLKVHTNGTWSIDHVDEVNPDKGMLGALLHLLLDAIPEWLAEFARTVSAAIQQGLMAIGQGVAMLLGHSQALTYNA